MSQNICSTWAKIAQEFDKISSGNSNSDILKQLIEERLDLFIRLSIDSRNTQLEPYVFKSDEIGSPDKTLHDQIFTLYSALDRVTPSKRITSTLLRNLSDSLLKCYPI